MAVNAIAPSLLLPITGVRIGAVTAGLYRHRRVDLGLIELAKGSVTAAVWTRNLFPAAPVLVAREHLEKSATRYCIANAGSANAGTGALGVRHALSVCRDVAKFGSLSPESVLPLSTGVIGESLPVAKIRTALSKLVSSLSGTGWLAFAEAIKTTDTTTKARSCEVALGRKGEKFRITAAAKGSGMINPNMATMLAILATDAKISRSLLQRMLRLAVAESFNAITVDGETSTNDACVMFATGKGQAVIDSMTSPFGKKFYTALCKITQDLAKDIVRDGEGATKFITIHVVGGKTTADSFDVARRVAHSPLVKTAFFASDPNWGRVLVAVGNATPNRFDAQNVSIRIGEVGVVKHGKRDPGYTEARGGAAMQKSEITIRIALGAGRATATLWTCDFSFDYVKINASYRS